MQTLTLDARREQLGFTLVELAIVLIIVGLLIGGILKGQELIGNARVASSVTQIKAIETAALTFQDTYNALPGDIVGATTRLPNCGAAPCSTAGNGNGAIGAQPGDALAGGNAPNEAFNFFTHLRAADLIDGVDGSGNVAVGQGVMAASLANGLHYRVGFAAGNANLAALSAGTARAGHYLTLVGVAPGTTVTANNLGGAGVPPVRASQIDTKYDDGLPNTGSALAATVGANAANCVTSNAVNSTYNTGLTTAAGQCGLYVRILQ